MRPLAALAALLLLSCAAQPAPHAAEKTTPSVSNAPQAKQAASNTLEEMKKLKPEIDRLVRQLGSGEYQARIDAGAALRKLGLPAVPALEDAAASADPQVAHLAGEVLEALRPDVDRVIISDKPGSSRQADLTAKLRDLRVAAPAIAKLSDVVEFLRTSVKVNIVVHPGLQRENPVIRLESFRGLLAEFLRKTASKLNAVWVVRFGVLYLADPVTAVEIAGADTLQAAAAADAALLERMGSQSLTLSLKYDSLAGVFGFFSEIMRFEFAFAEGADPNLAVHDLHASHITLRDAVGLVLFTQQLHGALANGKLTVRPADYSHLSRQLRNKRTRLRKYRKAWKTLP